MEFRIKKLSVEVQASTSTNIGEFPGSTLRGALIQAMVYRNCESLRYGKCDTCKDIDCPLKSCFMNEPVNSGHLETNPIIINTDFVRGRTQADRVKFSISLCGDDTSILAKEFKRILESGLFLGTPKTEFALTSLSEDNSVVDLSILDKVYDEYKDSTVRISIKTPFITNNKDSLAVNPTKVIRALTTRTTAMVRTLGIDYRVPYQQVLEDMEGLELIDHKVQKVSIQRKSTHHTKYQLLHGEIGEIVMQGDFSHIYPFLVIASQLSIGKECTMGFGEFDWEVLDKHE